MTDDPLTLLATVFATAASPAITEAIKHFKVPDGISPALNMAVAVALFTLGWAVHPIHPYPEYLLTALAVAGISTGMVSAAQAVPPRRRRG